MAPVPTGPDKEPEDGRQWQRAWLCDVAWILIAVLVLFDAPF